MSQTWELLKIIVDQRGTATDGSDTKTHSESLFIGTEQEMRKHLVEQNLTTKMNSEHAPMHIITSMVNAHGYILRKTPSEYKSFFYSDDTGLRVYDKNGQMILYKQNFEQFVEEALEKIYALHRTE